MEPKPGWEQWFLLSADRHWDNPYSDQSLQKKHLEEAKVRDARVLEFGDLFCCMQGKYDKRACKDDLRPEHQRGDYFDSLVKTAAEWFGPYAYLFAQMGEGNHETSVYKRHETNLIARLVERLNTEQKTRIAHAGFSGWVRFMFSRDGKGAGALSRKLAWHHGYGGDAPVTKGVIQTNRMSVYLPDADFVVTGHTHNEWFFPIPRVRISDAGQVFHDEQMHIKVPGYKEEYKDGYSGWHIERGGPPKPIGAAWLRFYYDRSAPGRVLSELHRAK